MKKILILMLAAIALVCLLASCTSGGADSIDEYTPAAMSQITEQGTFTFEESDGEGVILVSFVGRVATDAKIDIPATHEIDGDKLPVTGIADKVFYHLSSVVSVNIPSTVQSIGDWAFAECTELTAITLPADLKTIGEGAFEGCTKLAKADMTKATALQSIGNNAFRNCAVLGNVSLPATVTTVGNAAFWGCEAMTEVTFPDGLTTVGELAYYNCKALTTVTIPDSVTVIGNWAFGECAALEYNEYADENDNNAASYLGSEANPYAWLISVKDASTLTDCVIHKDTKGLYGSAFARCNKLETAEIPEGVVYVGEMTFAECDKLTSVTFPDSVKAIGKNAISAKTVVHCNGDTAAHDYARKAYSHVVCWDISAGKDDQVKAYYESATKILTIEGKGAMVDWEDDLLVPWFKAYNKGIEYVVIGEGVTNVGGYAFQRYEHLKSLVIPNTVTEIGKEIIKGCNALEAIYFGGTQEMYDEMIKDAVLDDETKAQLKVKFTNVSDEADKAE